MSAATPDRIETTALLAQQWSAITALVAGADEQRWRTPSPLPGWTVFDVVAHMIGTESMLLGEKPPASDDLDVAALAHVRNETAEFNETWVRGLRPLTGARLLERFTEVTDTRRAALAAMDDPAWAAETPSPIGLVSYGRFMRVRLFDCWMHELDIADAFGAHVEEGGRRGELAFAEFAASLPRVVVKRGGAPSGSRIRFELTGPLARTLDIAVDGRASYVDGFDEAPTVGIRLDSGLLVRLGGGRVDAETRLTEIEFTGDTDLGTRLVCNLAFTI
ncbi:maleylpyruvate isomerase family mycothiol-dependent enzyme [Nocardia bovistercoris]|uniref:Maleylpyruvate isomerase family mycothiol-dependent enzyme n=1 Tax=Nocardia bovistercoris TaxID=2785916 RepID=A0A931I9U9_9NOCA|nr:maleylpyruvate isomerase family mycothiol-dependent enzyme [Nocardia bovistercoris]MBH0777399.1 maleylpyruvate isomerase family mycothiol-dependent enzyme [Nocardia bovistercoris]